MAARGYEFYLRVSIIILTSEGYYQHKKKKIHIHKRACNVLFIIYISTKYPEETQFSEAKPTVLLLSNNFKCNPKKRIANIHNQHSTLLIPNV